MSEICNNRYSLTRETFGKVFQSVNGKNGWSSVIPRLIAQLVSISKLKLVIK